MASCDNTVLTGQEGLIQFKPLGTTNCVDDLLSHLLALVFIYLAALLTPLGSASSLMSTTFLLARVNPQMAAATPSMKATSFM